MPYLTQKKIIKILQILKLIVQKLNQKPIFPRYMLLTNNLPLLDSKLLRYTKSNIKSRQSKFILFIRIIKKKMKIN